MRAASVHDPIVVTHKDSFVEKVPRLEGESIEDWDDRIYAIWLAEEEEYALYGQFYQFKHIIRDDRPSTVVVRKADDSTLDQ